MPLWICTEGGFLSGSVVKNLPLNAGDPGDSSWILESARFPWRKKWQPTPVILPPELHRQKNLVGYSPWGHKESDTHTQVQKHFLLNVLFPYIVMSFKRDKAVVRVLYLSFVFSQMLRVVQCVGKREAQCFKMFRIHPLSLCQLDLCLYWSFKWGKGNNLLKLRQTGCLSSNPSEETLQKEKKKKKKKKMFRILGPSSPLMVSQQVIYFTFFYFLIDMKIINLAYFLEWS